MNDHRVGNSVWCHGKGSESVRIACLQISPESAVKFRGRILETEKKCVRFQFRNRLLNVNTWIKAI